jgi:hypothetical protein
MPTFLERYQNDEHEQVWDELLSYGDMIRQEPVFSDAMAVAHETMRRVRHNIELLAQRLRRIDYKFRDPAKVFVPPPDDTPAKIAEIEQMAGLMPIALRAWYEVVGSVNFTGHHLNYLDFFELAPLPDPLVVYSIDHALETCKDWHKSRAGDPVERLYCVPVGSGEYEKAGIGDQQPYEIVLPNESVDALLLHTWHRTTFVNYIRISLRWGGFAGFADPNTRPANIETLMNTLTSDLYPI